MGRAGVQAALLVIMGGGSAHSAAGSDVGAVDRSR
jgi:hypothetical protein